MRRIAIGIALLLLYAHLGCGEDAQLVPRQVQQFIEDIATPDGVTRGALVEGAAPATSPGGADVAAPIANATVVDGGSTRVIVSSDVAFATVLVLVANAEGYYQVNLPTTVTSAELVMTLASDAPLTTFDAVFGVMDSDDNVSVYRSTTMGVVDQPAGELQVSVSWDSFSDVDLSVTEPGGETISRERETSSAGGRFTLASNTGCQIDAVNNEAVSWPADTAPSGTYTARVSLADSCTIATTRVVVTVQRVGSSRALIFTATLQPNGSDSAAFTFAFPADGGDPCSGVDSSGTVGADCSAEPGACDGASVCVDGTCRQTCTTQCTTICGAQEACLSDSDVSQLFCAVPETTTAADYEPCGTTETGECGGSSRCLELTGLEAVARAFCSPQCGGVLSCPSFMESAGSCILGEDGSQEATRCVITCDPEADDCPGGMSCQPIADTAICVNPPG